MIRLGEAIIEMAAADDGDHAAALGQLRLTFSRAVIAHCEDEGAAVRNAVARGLIDRAFAESHYTLVMLWRADLAQCNAEWPTRRVTEDPQGYVRRFRPLVDALKQAAEIEEREILGKLDPHAPAGLTPANDVTAAAMPPRATTPRARSGL